MGKMQITFNLIGIWRKVLLLCLVIICVSASLESRDLGTTIAARLDGVEVIEQSYRSFAFNMTTLFRILRKLNYLIIYLHETYDFNNNLVRFLLEQQVCPVQLFIGLTMRHTTNADVKRFTLKFFVPPTNRLVTTKADELETTLLRFASKDGYMLCVIFGELNESHLKQVAEKLWNNRRIYRIYYFTRLNSWFYNPFALTSDGATSFGAIVDANAYCMECVFYNMNGYIVRTYIFDSVYSSVFGDAETKRITTVRGADSEAGLLLSEKLNFTMELQWPDDEFFGARLENGSYNGAIGRHIRAETDVTLSGFFVKDYLTREIIFTVSIYMDELCCYVMKARRVPQSILPLFAVRVDIWIGFFLVGLLSPLIWMLMRYLNLVFGEETTRTAHMVESSYSTYPLHSNFQYARIFTDTWVIWVRSTLTRFPPFYSERIFVASLCLVSVIYGALFESSLATVYIRPLYYKDINTLQELDDAGFRIYIKHAAMKDDLFYGHSSPVYQHLNRKLLLVAETEERLISMMSKRGGFAAVTRASSLLLDDIRYFITNKIHKIPECPKNYHIAFVLPRQSPFEEPFNVQLLYFLQAGLIEQWIDNMKHKAKTKIYSFPDYKAEKDNHWKVLTLKDLQLAFYTLGVGCTLASISLVGELFLKLKLKFCCFSTLNTSM